MENNNDIAAEFLSHLSEELKKSKDVDADLAEILTQYILIPNPADDCVEKAMGAIQELAALRATPSEESAHD
jgi:hypothetical protein